jgi:hypothetical protein
MLNPEAIRRGGKIKRFGHLRKTKDLATSLGHLRKTKDLSPHGRTVLPNSSRLPRKPISSTPPAIVCEKCLWASGIGMPLAFASLSVPQRSSDTGRSGSATAGFPVANKFLDPFASVYFGRVDIALAIYTHLVQPMKIARHSPTVPNPS